ncbi:MAG: hypothetical protein GX232_04090 [Acholeplasmataceae bacterium]|jgi:hypothetical protein|nr:hypothetical protein [Acholeplasmataceae bacterium]
MIQSSILGKVVYFLFADGLSVKSYSSFVKKDAVKTINQLFDSLIDKKIKLDEMEIDFAFEFKEKSLNEMNDILKKASRLDLWTFLYQKQTMFNLLEEIRKFIISDESDLDIVFDRDEYLTDFLNNFPDLYYESLNEANELLSNFNINYEFGVLYQKDEYVLGLYDGIVTTVPFEDFDGSTPYLKYYEIVVGTREKTLIPRYVLCGVDIIGIEI